MTLDGDAMPKKLLMAFRAELAIFLAASQRALAIAPMPLIRPLMISLPTWIQLIFLIAFQIFFATSPAAVMMFGMALPMPLIRLTIKSKPAARILGKF